jgi:hypothetical protein
MLGPERSSVTFRWQTRRFGGVLVFENGPRRQPDGFTTSLLLRDDPARAKP